MDSGLGLQKSSSHQLYLRLDRVWWAVIFSLILVFLAFFLAAPLLSVLSKIFAPQSDGRVGFFLLWDTITHPNFLYLLMNSLWVGIVTCLIVIPSAYIFAFGVNRTVLLGRSVYKSIGFLPLLAPSLMPGIALVYIGGNQGIVGWWFEDFNLYGFWGIVLGEAFYTFPHAFIILATSLRIGDGLLYDAAKTMGAGSWRRFVTITLPSTRYAIFSSICIVFTLTVTDFGVAKVIGGDFHVLALEVYQSVLGQQNFPKGAAVGLILLFPSVLTFAVDRYLRNKQGGTISGKTQRYHPQKNRLRDRSFFLLLLVISMGILSIVGVAIWASFIKFWPYNFSFSLNSYQFDQMDGNGWLGLQNSLILSFSVALLGTLIIFTGAWIVEKYPSDSLGVGIGKKICTFLVMLPMAIPGIVLGLGYVFFFNHPNNPLHFLYGSLGLMVICTIIHFYSSAHMTIATALRYLDPEFESAGASLQTSYLKTFCRISVSMTLPAAIDVARYLFVSSMTTVSALVFIYSPHSVVAAVSILNMDDAGFIGAAAALSTLIMLISAVVNGGLSLISRTLLKRHRLWHMPSH